MHVHTCTHFSAVDLKPENRRTIQSKCIVHEETADFQNEKMAGFPVLEEDQLSMTGFGQKTLNRHGYE